jgi:hypothetical protein
VSFGVRKPIHRYFGASSILPSKRIVLAASEVCQRANMPSSTKLSRHACAFTVTKLKHGCHAAFGIQRADAASKKQMLKGWHTMCMMSSP